jgi:hypothetical protein
MLTHILLIVGTKPDANLEREMKVLVDGIEYALVKSPITRGGAKYCLPKRGGSVEVVLNGAPFVAKVTDNKAWSGKDDYLTYIWIEVDGVSWYATLDAGVRAEAWKGAELTTADGVAKRANPPRETTDERGKVEAGRVAKFKEWAANN